MPASATNTSCGKKRKLRTDRNRDGLSLRLRFVIVDVRLCIPLAASEARDIPVALRDRNAILMHKGRFDDSGPGSPTQATTELRPLTSDLWAATRH
jgi:hypothetical protein